MCSYDRHIITAYEKHMTKKGGLVNGVGIPDVPRCQTEPTEHGQQESHDFET